LVSKNLEARKSELTLVDTIIASLKHQPDNPQDISLSERVCSVFQGMRADLSASPCE
jgi:hypothetical protein